MEENIRQLALVSSVLGGFSFTFVSAILSQKSSKKISLWVIGLGLSSAMCFLLAALGWTLLDFRLNSSLSDDEVASIFAGEHQRMVKFLLAGLIFIISSLGLSGWLQSRRLGIISLIICILSFAFLIDILSSYIVL